MKENREKEITKYIYAHTFKSVTFFVIRKKPKKFILFLYFHNNLLSFLKNIYFFISIEGINSSFII